MDVPGVMVPITMFICIAASVIGIPLARAFARRIDRAPDHPTLPPDVMARLERMEQAIDSIAVEVERISEGQRFTTKLLSERGAQSAAVVPAGQAPGALPR